MEISFRKCGVRCRFLIFDNRLLIVYIVQCVHCMFMFRSILVHTGDLSFGPQTLKATGPLTTLQERLKLINQIRDKTKNIFIIASCIQKTYTVLSNSCVFNSVLKHFYTFNVSNVLNYKCYCWQTWMVQQHYCLQEPSCFCVHWLNKILLSQ